MSNIFKGMGLAHFIGNKEHKKLLREVVKIAKQIEGSRKSKPIAVWPALNNNKNNKCNG
jgi:hypothetical protein